MQFVAVVPAMSKRSAQVAANIERYERQWRTEHPGQEPGPGLLRAWDERAWADHREAKKNHPTRGPECEAGWITELRDLGVDVDAHLAGRTGAGGRGAGRRGGPGRGRRPGGEGAVRRRPGPVHLERLRHPRRRRGGPHRPERHRPTRGVPELAEDVTARAHARCLSVLDRPVPDHIRHLTSQQVIDLEHDIIGRLAVRAGIDHQYAAVRGRRGRAGPADPPGRRHASGLLDEGQVAAVRAITGTGPLVLIEGAAGAGKTTVLATANDIITHHGHTMLVVAPSKKAAMVAAEETGSGDATTAHGLAYQHGFRWDTDGVWTRLRPGDTDPVTGHVYTGPQPTAQLTAGDVLVIDEAGMLDQETARALLHIADQADARVVFVGDRRQLPAVGRGGVLDMVAGWAPTQVELGAVHRFRTPDDHRRHRVRGPDPADPRRHRPRAVFDDLHTSAGTSRSGTARRTRSASSPGTPRTGTWTGRRRRCRWPPTTTPPRSTRSSGNNSSPPAPSTTPTSPTAPTGSASASATTS